MPTPPPAAPVPRPVPSLLRRRLPQACGLATLAMLLAAAGCATRAPEPLSGPDLFSGARTDAEVAVLATRAADPTPRPRPEAPLWQARIEAVNGHPVPAGIDEVRLLPGEHLLTLSCQFPYARDNARWQAPEPGLSPEDSRTATATYRFHVRAGTGYRPRAVYLLPKERRGDLRPPCSTALTAVGEAAPLQVATRD